MDRFSRLPRRSHGVRRASRLPGIVSVLLFLLLSLRVSALPLDGHAAAARPRSVPVLALATASDEQLQRCRYLHRRIEHFTRLRRSGGSGAQMERWRRSRQRFEEEYRRKRCFRFGRKLKDLR